MISENRKQKLIELYSSDKDGVPIQALVPEERKLVLQWQYAYYQGEMQILKAILDNIQTELDKLKDF